MSHSSKKGGFRRFLRSFIEFFLRAIILLILFTAAQVALIIYINPPSTVYITWKRIQAKIHSEHYIIPDMRWRDLKDISPFLIKAVMAGEDQRFMTHNGFDFIEMNRAVKDLISARRVRGASTITMQVARTIFLWPERSWARKMIEAYYTVLIEIFWSKTRILEIYLNYVDWGFGIMGAEAASQKYFHESSSNISASQASLLVAILPSPHVWSPLNPNKTVIERQKRILKDMNKMHL
ncbi:MAG: monofunctional biosynthetic peptidoglycan transglycosylase [Deltaproteobacteria bacterium]|nr:monofunctional biosynthetic peptidoglycan transglycosylase [Deltaproteobacteria bacterium]